MKRVILPDVLTLEEASAYLRLPIESVQRQALQGDIPGRKVKMGMAQVRYLPD